MRAALLGVLAFFAIACAHPGRSGAQAREVSVADRYAQVAQSVVAIEVEMPAGSASAANAAVGSGVLISAEGRVLTAAHVVQTANTVKVHFNGGENIQAKVLRSDPAADVALLQLDHVPPGTKPAKLGNSDDIRVGDPIFVIGAPHGLTRTLTVGNVSARHREDASPVGLSIAELFQTDAAINQGNSGGPMFNMDGEVVGIVSHIMSFSGGYEGLGFAVTSNAAMTTLSDQGSIWSGLDWVGLDGSLAQAFNVPQATGILVQNVANGSLGAKLGIRGGYIPARVQGVDLRIGGDIILEVQGVTVSTDGSLRKRFREKLASLEPGDEVHAKVLRAGEVITLRTEFVLPEQPN